MTWDSLVRDHEAARAAQEREQPSAEWMHWREQAARRAASPVVDTEVLQKKHRGRPRPSPPAYVLSCRPTEGMDTLACICMCVQVVLDHNTYRQSSMRTSDSLAFLLTVCEAVGCILKWRGERTMRDIEIVAVVLHRMVVEFDRYKVPPIERFRATGAVQATNATWAEREWEAKQRNITLRVTTELFAIPADDAVHPWRLRQGGSTLAFGEAPLSCCHRACTTPTQMTKTLLDMLSPDRCDSARIECSGACGRGTGPHVVPVPFATGPRAWGISRSPV